MFCFVFARTNPSPRDCCRSEHRKPPSPSVAGKRFLLHPRQGRRKEKKFIVSPRSCGERGKMTGRECVWTVLLKREREFSVKTVGTEFARARQADFLTKQERPSRNIFYVSLRDNFYSGKMNGRSFALRLEGVREGLAREPLSVAVLSQFHSSHCSRSIIGIVLFRRVIFNARTHVRIKARFKPRRQFARRISPDCGVSRIFLAR